MYVLRSQTLKGAPAKINSLATNLYHYELVQNAEDNHYNLAAADSQTPYIQFSICRHQIVVDLNEDGFTPDEVRAISNIDMSTKTRFYGRHTSAKKGLD
jgi:hypothetical protein